MKTATATAFRPALLGLLLALSTLLGSALAQTTVTVGATPVPHAEVLQIVRPLLEEQGIELEIVEFTDYVQPNLALAAGDLDANFFQHVPYLEQFSADRGLDLAAIATVHVEPMGVYSASLDSLEALEPRSTIAIPNDPTNGGRALLLLQSAGVLELDPDAGLAATPLDVTENPLGLRFRELEAAQLPRSLQDVDAAVINTNYALEAGLNPSEDALLIEDERSPYANVLVVRSERQDDPALRALAEALNSEPVRRFLEQEYGGAIVPAF